VHTDSTSKRERTEKVSENLYMATPFASWPYCSRGEERTDV